jgi:cytidylate kinase
MNKLIVVLAGLSCVGKSTIGKTFCEKYGFDLINQQSIYRKIAKSKGYTLARKWLADVGNEVFTQETIDAVAIEIAGKKSEQGILVDETYGTRSLDYLRSFFPDRTFVIVAVRAKQSSREQRMEGRIGADREAARKEMYFRDNFLIQSGIEDVLKIADINLENKHVETCIQELRTYLLRYTHD